MRVRAQLICFAVLSLLAAASRGDVRSFEPAEQMDVIRAAADLIETRYVYPDRARTIATKLRRSGSRWQTAREGEDFASAATAYLREISGDGHLGLSFSAEPIAEEAGEEEFSAEQMNQWYGPQINHGIEKIERLDGNIMLLDLRVFPPAAMAGDVFAAAMTIVAQGEALIIDLRRNGGGSDTMQLLTGYLLDEPQPLSGSYDRPSDTHAHAVSPAWVPGRRFGATKPLFILTSKKTFSAAEALAYDLQALGRARIVGEATGGGAHPFEYRRVHSHFAVDLPEARSINPITGSNWQDVGVRPDVAVPSEQALEKALELARAAIGDRS